MSAEPQPARLPVVVIDDDPALRRLFEIELRLLGFEAIPAATAGEGLERIAEVDPTFALLDLRLPDRHGTQVLEELQRRRSEVPIVVISSETQLELVVSCMKLGAVDYVTKPLDRVRFAAAVSNASARSALRARLERVASEARRGDGFESFLGTSAPLQASVSLLRQAALADVTVLLSGESGTGKEVAARAIHAESARRRGPFVAVNCGAIPETLLESELFGHEKGAFTGATSARAGRFEQAHEGTLFLDEVGELRLDLQVKLLRVLQERAVQRLGAASARPVDLRIVAATNRDLEAEVRERRFREDLYYRIAVFPVQLPPLRERGDDVIVLARAFAERAAARHGRAIAIITPEAEAALRRYRWPGNVRQLQNVIERATIIEQGSAISLASLPDDVVLAVEPTAPAPAPPPAAAEAVIPFEEEERRIILRALEASGWDTRLAAERLRLSRATIYRKIEHYGLRRG